MSDGIFDERIAPHYDAGAAAMFDDAVLGPTVEFLADLAGDGRALELAAGTGRVALPLSDRGVPVAGIELSQAMADQMRAKPGAERVPITIGDMATARVDGEFRLVFLVYNTISNLLTQGEQVQCFRNASDHLERGGYFVIELFVPDLRRLPWGERFALFDTSDGHVGIDEYDVAEQRVVSHHYDVTDGRVATFASPHRYAWPSELDLMATLAGMELHQRWSSWDRAPFTNESTSHISVWRKV